MIKSSKLVALFSFGLIAFGGITALKSNGLNSVKIFTYQMKPIFSPGDRQSATSASASANVGEKKRRAQKKADKIIANKIIANKIITDLKKDMTLSSHVKRSKITKTSYVKDAPKGDILLNEKQSFSSLQENRLTHKQPQSLLSSYRVASASPINIIPDYSLPKKFVRSYERLVMGKEIKTIATRNSPSYRGTLRQNGPVMLRPTIYQREAVRKISTARLPISSAKSVKASQTAMR